MNEREFGIPVAVSTQGATKWISVFCPSHYMTEWISVIANLEEHPTPVVHGALVDLSVFVRESVATVYCELRRVPDNDTDLPVRYALFSYDRSFGVVDLENRDIIHPISRQRPYTPDHSVASAQVREWIDRINTGVTVIAPSNLARADIVNPEPEGQNTSEATSGFTNPEPRSVRRRTQ
jgi:hypothetical protein